jgi:transglutaminase-like putative cysteine protease
VKHDPWFHTIQPHSIYALHGLTHFGRDLLALDSVRGYLLQISCTTDNTIVLNPYHAREFIGATSLALWDNTLWFCRDDRVYFCPFVLPSDLDESSPDRMPIDLHPKPFISLPHSADGVAIGQTTVYVSCQRTGYIYVFNRETAQEIARFYAPGVGLENLTIQDDRLWVSDATEQTVYCLDRATGEIQLSVLTPFESPTALTFHVHPETGETIPYVAYAYEEPYVRDNPNATNPHELTYRDRSFIHPLRIHQNPEKHYTLSNGYSIEMSYVEELSPLEAVELSNLEWRIGLPMDTLRQKVRHVEPIGLPFREEVEGAQRRAVFEFDRLTPHEARVFGWKALIEVRGLKYHLTPRDVEKLPELPQEYRDRYLVDNDNLAMDTEIVQRAAKSAIGRETNLLRQVLSIRDYVYDRLSYAIKPHIDTPDIVLQRGRGSCGEYVGVLLALLRLNGIACRTVGRYKCPAKAEYRQIPMQPDFNHVWLEFYIPGFGWVPMESNPDDADDRGAHPLRFFMGLAWYHVEMTKGSKFEMLTQDGQPLPKELTSLGELAINHVRFRILSEIE